MNKLIAVCLVLLSFNVHASRYTCSGKVIGVSLDAKSGDVLVERIGPLSWPRLCKVDNEHDNISAEACRTIYSTLLTAQTTNKEVTLWFNDSKDCSESSHQPWKWLTGCYFGPKLEN
ncbi:MULTISPECIES: hypothetical protein [Vibrio]|uniref:hypothetical protein n=1 Tax=Vibrio TaxID=662 RepID=UPI000769ABC7|nr:MULTISPECIES: hypothetical protein [Vibrio]